MEPNNSFSPADPSVNKTPPTENDMPASMPSEQAQQPQAPEAPKTDLHSYQFDQSDVSPDVQMPGGEIQPGSNQTQSVAPQPQVSPSPASFQVPVTPSSNPNPANPLTGMTSNSPVHSANNWQRWRDFRAKHGKGGASDGSAPSAFGAPTPRRGSNKLKVLILAAVAVVVVGGGASAYYFGYYTNPNVIWGQSLDNTAKGYDKLVDYLNKTETAHYKGVSEDGTFKYQAGGTNYDGSMSLKSDGTNATGSVDVGLGVTRLSMQLRSVKAANADSPDLYVQMNGITGLGDFLGSDFGKQVNSLNGQWIVLDRTFLEDIKGQITKSTSKTTTLKWADVVAAAKSLSDVNKQYVFTTGKDKSVTTIVKKYGTVTVDGHKTYHYQVGFVKQNVKSYVTALRDSLKASKLGAWLQAETGKSIDDVIGYSDLEKSADRIKSSDTIDVWTDTKTRLIYKIRASDTTDPVENYIDFGLNYTGGDTYPFFISGKSKTGSSVDTGAFTATLNTKTNEFTIGLTDSTTGDSKSSFTGKFTFKPNDAAVNVTAPAGAKSLMQVLDQLGLSDLMDELLSSTSASAQSGSGIGSFGSSL